MSCLVDFICNNDNLICFMTMKFHDNQVILLRYEHISDCDSTRLERKSCGWARRNKSVRSTLVTFQSYQSSSKSSRPPVTLLLSTANCHSQLCRHALLSSLVTLCRSAFYHTLQQLRPIARSLSTEAAKTLLHAFISSGLDYCNSLLFGVPDVLLRKVQSVQNAAARLVTGAKRRDHIMPVLQQLHWLPVRRRFRHARRTW